MSQEACRFKETPKEHLKKSDTSDGDGVYLWPE